MNLEDILQMQYPEPPHPWLWAELYLQPELSIMLQFKVTNPYQYLLLNLAVVLPKILRFSTNDKLEVQFVFLQFQMAAGTVSYISDYKKES